MATLGIFTSVAVRAATIVWANLGTDFATGANWGGTAPADSIVTDLASFGTASPTFQPNLAANRSVNGLVFANTAGAFTVSGTGGAILTLGTGGIAHNDDSTQTLAASLGLKLGAAAPFTLTGTGALTIASAVNNNAFLLTLSGSTTGAGTVSGVISGTAGLTKSGTGTWTLSGTNTYTGVTTISGGTLAVSTIGNGGVAGNLGSATNAATNLVFSNGTLRYTGANAATDRKFTIAAATTATFEVPTANLTLAGNSTATTGLLAKTGTGTLTLTGLNLHTGLTTASVGTLAYGVTNALATGVQGNYLMNRWHCSDRPVPA